MTSGSKRVNRALRQQAKVRRQVARMNELARVVKHELEVADRGGGVVTDVSSGYDNRAMGWQDHDERRPVIGFSL